MFEISWVYITKDCNFGLKQNLTSFTLIAMSGIIYVIYDWFITFREKTELLV